MQAVTLLLMVQLFGSGTDYLEYYFHSTLFAVISCDGQRNTFTVGIGTEYYKLSGLSFFATNGASISIMVTVGLSAFFVTILYISFSILPLFRFHCRRYPGLAAAAKTDPYNISTPCTKNKVQYFNRGSIFTKNGCRIIKCGSLESLMQPAA